MKVLEYPCPDCGAKLVLKNSKHGKFYGCEKWAETKCTGAIGCHPGTDRSLGIPANKETRDLRIQAHEVFDELWRNSSMTRRESYRWMEKELNLKPEEAHIGRFNAEQCRQLIERVSILTKSAGA